MSVLLDQEEAGLIRWMLEKYLPEMRYELARVKLERHRHELAEKERLLTGLLPRLAEAEHRGETAVAPG